MAEIPTDLIEEIQQAQSDPGPDRRQIAQAELPNTADTPPIRVHVTDTVGYVRVFHVGDQDVRVIPRSVLASVLSKKLPDGRRAFTTRIPNVLPKVGGDLVCFLHPNHPDSGLFFTRGYQACRGDHFRTEMDVQLHLEHKHRSAARWWASHKAELEHQATLAMQKQLTEAITLLAQRE